MVDLLKTGVPAQHVIESNIASYIKGFEDAIECLNTAKQGINIEEMRKLMIKKFKEASIINDEF